MCNARTFAAAIRISTFITRRIQATAANTAIDKEFLKRVTAAISHAGAILITGPANAKTELAHYIKQSQPNLAERISGVETLDHPSDGELLALARTFFKADDRMHPQSHR
jgi:stalled ribosome rescue protein Dom34